MEIVVSIAAAGAFLFRVFGGFYMCDESEKTVGSACDAGYYYRAASGAIAFAVGDARFVFRDGDKLRAERLPSVYFEWLPDCTGWDWQPPQPIDPGEGWRLLEDGEKVLEGDELYRVDRWETVMNWVGAGTQSPFPYRRRIAPAYRPFANRVEAEAFLGRVVRHKSSRDGYRELLTALNETQVKFQGAYFDYQYAFGNLVFVDGTPFGIKETP